MRFIVSVDEEIWKLGVVNGFEKINYIYYFMLGLVVVLLDKKNLSNLWVRRFLDFLLVGKLGKIS